MKFYIETWGCQNRNPIRDHKRSAVGAGAQRAALCDLGVVRFIDIPLASEMVGTWMMGLERV